MKWVVITTQREFDKPSKEVNEAVAEGFLRNWHLVCEQFVTDCEKQARDIGKRNYTLDTANLQQAQLLTIQALRVLPPIAQNSNR